MSESELGKFAELGGSYMKKKKLVVIIQCSGTLLGFNPLLLILKCWFQHI